MKKKLLSIILVAMLSTNAIPYTAFAENGESSKTTAEEAANDTEDNTEEPSEEETPEEVTVIDMSEEGGNIRLVAVEHNGNYSYKDLRYEISKLDSKDVELAFEFDYSKDSNNNTVAKIKTLTATGNDAGLFEFKNAVGTQCIVERTQHIVDVRPTQLSIKLGKSIGSEIECEAVNENADIDENVKYFCKVKTANNKPDEGEYEFEGLRTTHGDYTAQFDQEYTFKVVSGELEQSVLDKLPKGTESLRGETTRTIKAPDGYEISTKYDEKFGESITLELNAEDNSADYYVRQKNHETVYHCKYNYVIYANTTVRNLWVGAGNAEVVDNGKAVTTNGRPVIKVLLEREDDTELKDITLKVKKNNDNYDLMVRHSQLNENDVDILSMITTTTTASATTTTTTASGSSASATTTTASGSTPSASAAATVVTAPVQNNNNGIVSVEYEGNKYYYAEFVLPETVAGDADVYKNFRLELSNDDNTRSESLTKELSTDRDKNGTHNSLIVDKRKPIIASGTEKDNGVAVTFDNVNGRMDCRLSVNDLDSGIKSVRYKWDFESAETEPHEATGTGNSGGKENLKFSFSTKLTDELKNREEFYLEIFVTDNAGNLNEKYVQKVVSKWDTEPAEVVYARFLDEHYAPAEIEMNDLGNFTNKPRKLAVFMKDKTAQTYVAGIKNASFEESGKTVNAKIYPLASVENIEEYISKITVVDGKEVLPDDMRWPLTEGIINCLDDPEQIKKIDEKDRREGLVVLIFDVEDISKLSNLDMKVDDSVGNQTLIHINNAVTGMIKNSVIYDNTVPDTDVTFYENGKAHKTGTGQEQYAPDDEGRVWLNENDTSFKLSVNDSSSGLKTVYVQKINDETHEVVCEDFLDISKDGHSSELSVALLKSGAKKPAEALDAALDDGKYSYNFVVTDNANNIIGNRYVPDKDLTYVMYKVGVYKGKVTAYSEPIAGISMPIDNKIWADKKDNVSVKIKLDGIYAGKADLRLKVNNVDVDYEYDDKTGILTAELYSKRVKIPFDNKQQYKLELTGHDNARHPISLSAQDEEHPLKNDTIYVDTQNPSLTKIQVEKVPDIVEEKLNFFTFGAFANNAVVLKAIINEPNFDSGLDSVYIDYVDENGVATQEKMSLYNRTQGTYAYTYMMPLGGQAFYNDIRISVVDNCGKTNLEKEFKISSDGIDSKNCVVVEHNDPVISIGIPESDRISEVPEENEGTEESELTDAGLENETELIAGEEETELKENEIAYPYHIGNYGSDTLPEDGIWYSENKHFSVKIVDAQSGIDTIEMSLNGTPIDPRKYVTIPEDRKEKLTDRAETDAVWFGFDTEVLHQELEKQPIDGYYYLDIKAKDNSGNEVKEPVRFEYHLDDVDPQIEKFIFSPSSSDKENETSSWLTDGDAPLYTYFFANKFWAIFRIKDEAPTSGLNRVDYKLLPYENGEPVGDKAEMNVCYPHYAADEFSEDSEEYKLMEALLEEERKTAEDTEEETEFNGKTGYAWIQIPDGFKGQIFAEVYDNVGHHSGDMTTHAYVTDNAAPTVEINGVNNTRYSDEEGNKLYSSEKEVTVTIKDTQSGIRKIDCYINSEKRQNDGESIDLRDYDLEGADEIEGGWRIVGRDRNLVTEVQKTFRFDSDDNGITITASAGDNSGNHSEDAVSDKFTVDLTDPVIDVDINEGIDGTHYYSADHKPEIDIKITERNFDAELINTTLNNTFGTKVPQVYFTKVSDTEHTAHLVFDEGDFTFDIRGTDRAGHSAKVNMDRSKFGKFYMDSTAPVVTNNFGDFANDKTGNYLNSAKNIEITVVEHNFDPERSGLKIWQKDPGSEHDNTGFTDVTNSVISRADWKSDNDTHTLSAQLKKDGVYKIEVAPSDPSGNSAASASTAIFELDTTKPQVTEKNGKRVDKSNAEKFLDVYNSSRKDEAIPTVEFADANFDHLKYVLTVYAPQYKNGKELAVIRPQNMFLPEDKDETGTLASTKFALPEFDKDGVYALELIAVDKAGNESYLNSNTYMRLMDNDVLAYIPNSSQAKKTGWYSFQYENGEPISKRPDNFSDIEIVVFSEKNSDVNVVLRDYNGDEKITGLVSDTDPSLYGVNISRFTLGSDYFKSNFGDDTDTELYLSVKNDDARIDLGRLHIDNIEPECDLPKSLKSWKWFAGNKPRTITVSNINEQLDMSNCKVYDNGKEIDFDYSPEDRSLSFKLEKGWHRVGVKLEDEAGNVYSIQEIDNLYIGYFWLWVILGSAAALGGLAAFIISKIRKKRLY